MKPSCQVFAVWTMLLVFQVARSQGGQASNSTAESQTYVSAACDPILLASYGLDPLRVSTREKNHICKNVKANCCTARSQQNLYDQWVGAGARENVAGLYINFLTVFDSIFERFKDVEKFAEKVAKNSEKRPYAICNQYANAVVTLNASAQKSKVLGLAKKAFRFLYDARRGFPCSLCDAEAHKAIDGELGRIKLTHFFCSKLVEETLGFSIFKHKDFMKIARSLGQFVQSCNAQGLYKPNASLKYDIKFFKEPVLYGEVDKCQKNIKDEQGIHHCHDYCAHFNPVRFDRMFEDDLAKLNSFNRWLRRSLKKLVAPPKSAFDKSDLKFAGRILSESQSSANKTSTFTGISYTSAVNHFREEFGIQLKTGITYSAAEDFITKYNTNFNDSLYPTAFQPLYNLAKFTVDFNKEGLNYLIYGYKTVINDSTLSQILARNSTNGTSSLFKGMQNLVKQGTAAVAQKKKK